MLKKRMNSVLLLTLALTIGAIRPISGFSSEYIVKVNNKPALYSLNMRLGSQIKDLHFEGNLLKIKLPEDTRQAEILANILKSPDVEYVVENFRLKAFETPIEEIKLREQWAIAKVNAERAWNLAKNKGNKNVIVAVIDTGVDYTHESLAPNMMAGFDFVRNNNDPQDITSMQNPGHGTHCAGIVGATGKVNQGVIGLSPEVTMMPLRFLDEKGSGDLMNGIKAIDYAIKNGAQVISASWGAAVPAAQAKPLTDAVKRANDAGVIFVAAAANDGKNNDKVSMFPANANFAHTITVAASGPNDEKPSWSNFGRRRVQVAAPGLNIMSTLPKNKYQNLSGTSMATPLVSGLVALLKAQDPTLTGAEIKALIQTTGAKVAIETACNCRVDAGEAMDSLLAKRPFVVPAAETLEVGASLTASMKFAQGAVSFKSSKPEVATVDAVNGVVTAVAAGSTQIIATDSNGATAQSLEYFVIPKGGESDGGGDDGGGGLPTDCPFEDAAMCEMICAIIPQAPWCK